MGGGVTSNAVCAVGRGLGGAAVATRIDVAQVERRGGGRRWSGGSDWDGATRYGSGGAAAATRVAQSGAAQVGWLEWLGLRSGARRGSR